MSYINLDSIYRATAGSLVPHAWADQVNDNSTYLYNQVSGINTTLTSVEQIRVYQSLVYRAASYSLANNTLTLFPFDSVEWDGGATMFSTSTNLWTAPVAGLYDISGNIAFTSATTGQSYLDAQINGGGGGNYNAPRITLATGAEGPIFHRKIHLAAGNTVGIAAFQNSGGSAAVTIGNGNNWATFGLVAPDAL